MPIIITPEQIAEMIPDGATLMIGGFMTLLTMVDPSPEEWMKNSHCELLHLHLAMKESIVFSLQPLSFYVGDRLR